MPEDLGNLYVEVNIPEFVVRVVKGGEIIHEERIVSGRDRNADADLLKPDAHHRCAAPLERAGLHQDQRASSGPESRRRSASGGRDS